MANSRQLVECVAKALEKPLTEVTGHMRHLREAEFVTVGGRGVTAPRMTYEDAATLVCSLYGAELMKDGVASVKALKSLPANYRGERRPPVHSSAWFRSWNQRLHLLGSEPERGLVAGLAAMLRILAEGNDILRHAAYERPTDELRARLTVQYPRHFASLMVNFAGVSEVWTFGERGKPRTRQTRECDEVALREIAECVKAS